MSKEGALQPGGANRRSLRMALPSLHSVVLSGLGHVILTNQHTGQCVDLDGYRLKKLTQAPENKMEKLIIFAPAAFLQWPC